MNPFTDRLLNSLDIVSWSGLGGVAAAVTLLLLAGVLILLRR